jgi:antirestriction protein ArdC
MAHATTTDLIRKLTEGVAALTGTQQWERWLRAQRSFHRYSFSNVLLILRQCPDATQVAGFHRWHELGRFVRKGERGIAILAPVTRRVDADDDSDAAGLPVVTGFRPAYVFDVGQTDGEPLPEIARRLDGDDPAGVSVRLEKVAAELGFSVTDTQLPGERNGDCSHALRRIRIRDGIAPAQRVKTLAHELAHAILHEQFEDRGLAELEAESVAYIVCHELALDSSAYSFGYLAIWGRSGDEATRAITASGGRIATAARQILGALEGDARP